MGITAAKQERWDGAGGGRSHWRHPQSLGAMRGKALWELPLLVHTSGRAFPWDLGARETLQETLLVHPNPTAPNIPAWTRCLAKPRPGAGGNIWKVRNGHGTTPPRPGVQHCSISHLKQPQKQQLCKLRLSQSSQQMGTGTGTGALRPLHPRGFEFQHLEQVWQQPLCPAPAGRTRGHRGFGVTTNGSF